MYKIFRQNQDRIIVALGLDRWLPRRNKLLYREFWALKGLDLKVKKGERLGIIGHNGAGKSTLLKIITGNISLTEGSMEIDGKIQALIELGIGFHPEFTGRENIRASLAYHGLSPAEIKAKEEEIIDFAELEDFIDQPVKTYSSGMYTRLAFSTSTSIEPEILIIDEVLGAGDAYFYGKCVERMKWLTIECGATVLFVSHNLATVQTLCNRVIWINKGQVKQDGDPLSVIKAYYKEVQERENLRLRAQAQGLSNRMVAFESNSSNHHLLFHLTTPDGKAPAGKHKVRKLRLFHNDDQLCEIDVGSAMDNDPESDAFLICEHGQQGWSDPFEDNQGSYRLFTDKHSKYKHAPFNLSFPHSLREGESDSSKFHFEIEAEIDPIDVVFAEVYLNDKYENIGRLEKGDNTYRFNLDLSSTQAQSELAPVEPLSRQDFYVRFFFQAEMKALPINKAVHIKSIALIGKDDIKISEFRLDEHLKPESEFIHPESWSRPLEAFGETGRVVELAGDNLPGIVFELDEGARLSLTEKKLVVRALPSTSDCVRILVKHEYELIPVAELLPEAKPRWKDFIFDLEIIHNLDSDFKTSQNERPQKSIVTWGVPDPRIEKVRIMDGSGLAVTGIEEESDLIVEINYFSSNPVENPVFAMTIYLLDGTRIAHANSVLGETTIRQIEGRGRVRFMFSPFRGGVGEYMISASIFKFFDPTLDAQPPYYDQHDRAYRFRVWKRIGIAMDLGVLKIPYTISHRPEKDD